MNTFDQGIGLGSSVLWMAYRAYVNERGQQVDTKTEALGGRRNPSRLRQQIGDALVRFGRLLQRQSPILTTQSR